jgi:hypothetical protein
MRSGVGRAGLLLAFALAATLGACHRAGPAEEPPPASGGDPPPLDGDDPPPGSGVQTPPATGSGEAPSFPSACADVYADDLLATFEVDVSEADWAALQQDSLEGEESYYPAVFRYGAEVVPDAMIRLRGNNSRCGDKLQFAISFNQVDRDGRFHGLRRINLDHGGCNLLEERLALSFMRDLGLPAACANHARLVVNGRYYGLFLSIEHVNKDFLRRNFGPAADDGNLYKSGGSLHTNEEENDTSDLRAYEAAADATALAALVDLDEAVAEWAAEAVLPARDNYWLFGWNYYLYQHPHRGFLFIPTDLDRAFPASSNGVELDTLLPDVLQRAARIALADPEWRLRYEEAVRRTVDGYDPAVLAERLDRWWAQVAPAVAEDPFATYSASRVSALEARIEARAAWLSAALEQLGW